MSKPTPEAIAKLPRWAQEHISDLERQRESAVRALNEYLDDQTKSGVYIDDWVSTGEVQGPKQKIRYIQTNRVNFEHAGVCLSVYLSRPDDGQRLGGIDVSYGSIMRGMQPIAMVPKGFQQIEFVTKEMLR